MTVLRWHKIHKSERTHLPMTHSSPPYRGYHSNPDRIPYWIIIMTHFPLCPDLDPIGSSDMTDSSDSSLIRSTIHKSDSFTLYPDDGSLLIRLLIPL